MNARVILTGDSDLSGFMERFSYVPYRDLLFQVQQRPLAHEAFVPERALAPTLLATVSKQAGYEAHAVDGLNRFARNIAELEELIQEKTPLAVGLSTSFLQGYGAVRDRVQLIRGLGYRGPVVLGGASVINHPEIRELGDISVVGHGEQTWVDLLAALEGKGRLSDVAGIVFRGEDGALHATDARAQTPWPQIPVPRWKAAERMAYLPLLTSHGCPCRCMYCNYSYIEKPAHAQVDQVMTVIKSYLDQGNPAIFFVDNTLSHPKERLAELCRRIIAERLPVAWDCVARADHISPELAGLMAKAGCVHAILGIESGSDSMLERMGKNTTASRLKQVVSSMRSEGIVVEGSFVLGFPGETAATVEQTIDFIVGSQMDTANLQVLEVYEGSRLWKRREAFGLEGRGLDWKHHTMDAAEAAEHAEYAMGRLMAESRTLANGTAANRVAGFLNCYDVSFARFTSYLEDLKDLQRYFGPKAKKRDEDYQKTCGRIAELFDAVGIDRRGLGLTGEERTKGILPERISTNPAVNLHTRSWLLELEEQGQIMDAESRALVEKALSPAFAINPSGIVFRLALALDVPRDKALTLASFAELFYAAASLLDDIQDGDADAYLGDVSQMVQINVAMMIHALALHRVDEACPEAVAYCHRCTAELARSQRMELARESWSIEKFDLVARLAAGAEFRALLVTTATAAGLDTAPFEKLGDALGSYLQAETDARTSDERLLALPPEQVRTYRYNTRRELYDALGHIPDEARAIFYEITGVSAG